MERYLHQINLPEISIAGQKRLQAARVLCVGSGGLGSSLLYYLAAAGIGKIGIVDPDTVSLSNLHRQILYDENAVGKPKVLAAKERLSQFNSECEIIGYPEKFTFDNGRELIRDYDIIADCCDNLATRYLINDLCYQTHTPFFAASALQWVGQCMSFLPPHGPCFRCLFPEEINKIDRGSCQQWGVLGVVPGLLGVIQATEILKWIIQKGPILTAKLSSVDCLAGHVREYVFERNKNCVICENSVKH